MPLLLEDVLEDSYALSSCDRIQNLKHYWICILLKPDYQNNAWDKLIQI